MGYVPYNQAQYNPMVAAAAGAHGLPSGGAGVDWAVQQLLQQQEQENTRLQQTIEEMAAAKERSRYVWRNLEHRMMVSFQDADTRSRTR